MISSFKFDIPNKRSNQIRLLSNLILFLNALVFLYLGFKLGQNAYRILGALAVLAVLLDVAFKKEQWVLQGFAALLIAYGYYSVGSWYIGALFLILSFLAERTASARSILFDNASIQFKAPFTKTIDWSELQNVVLKDGLLTLDFRNNRLLQTSTINELTEAETKQFNDFCQEKLQTRQAQ